MNKKIWLIIIIALALRLVLALISFHPDIKALDFAAQMVREGRVFNLYDFLFSLPADSPILKSYPMDFFNYPPSIYLFHGFFSIFFSPLLSQSFINSFLFNFPSTLGNWQLNLHLLFLKLPYLIFDLAGAYFLIKMFESSRNKLAALLLWMFNPINLYATYLMGQFDIIPTFFVILALYLIQKNKSYKFLSSNHLAVIALGLGAAFKIYPIFLLIPVAFLEDRFLDKIKTFCLGILVYFLTIIPFIFSQGFRSTALLANQTLKSLYPQIPISGGESILLFLALLVFFYLIFFYNSGSSRIASSANIKGNTENLWQRFFLILLLFFIFTHYHPQWFLWITPFLIIELVETKFKHLLLVGLSLVSFTVLLFLFEPSLTLGLFSPVVPSLNNTPGIWEILHIKIDTNLLRSVFQTVFVGVGIYYIYYYFPKDKAENNV